MSELVKAIEPFHFFLRFHLSESTGIRASSIGQLLDCIRMVPGASIYHHTHRYLQQHEFFSPEPPNDFAYWITDVIREEKLGELVASIDIVQFQTIRSLRENIVQVIENYISANPDILNKKSSPEKDFWFIKAISFIVPTNNIATDLQGFVDILSKIDTNSLYFHIFEARLRLENKKNDFSHWIETSIGDKELAEEISRIDPYTYAMEYLRQTLIKIVTRRIST